MNATCEPGGMDVYEDLVTPAVIVDLDTVDANLRGMAKRLSRVGIQHRPHVKTHKSILFAERQREAGAMGITVAKLSEAEVFANAGFDDILLAYAIVGDDKLARFEALHQRIHLLTTVDSIAVAEGLSRVGESTGKSVPVLIEVDGGGHRGGRQPGGDTVEFARSIRHLQGIRIRGIMGYFGGIYGERDVQGIATAAQREAELLTETRDALQQAGFPVDIVSAGSTPASHAMEQMAGVTEIRAGNYIFNDVTAMNLGIAGVDDCALRVVVTVISTPLPGHATIDAGTKTLTSDLAHHSSGYGHVVGYPNVVIEKLNEEHGMLLFHPEDASFQVGDRLEIVPNHSCVLPNLTNVLLGVRGGQVVERITVDARGCNY